MRPQYIRPPLLLNQLHYVPTRCIRKDYIVETPTGLHFRNKLSSAIAVLRHSRNTVHAIAILLNRLAQPFRQNIMPFCPFFCYYRFRRCLETTLVAGTTRFDKRNKQITSRHMILLPGLFAVSLSPPRAASYCATAEHLSGREPRLSSLLQLLANEWSPVRAARQAVPLLNHSSVFVS
jgi:hypothetical protein